MVPHLHQFINVFIKLIYAYSRVSWNGMYPLYSSGAECYEKPNLPKISVQS